MTNMFLRIAPLQRRRHRPYERLALFGIAALLLTAQLGCAGEASNAGASSNNGGQSDCNACGDGTCSAACGENKKSCPVDCKACGDGICSPAEGPIACAEDCCGGCGDGKCRGYACGEDPQKCPQDCGTACGNKTCDKGETPQSCAEDCKWQVCGNGTCEPSDLGPWDCPQDCGPTCGNCTCEKGEDFIVCPGDCGYCGDNVCSMCTQLGENPGSCAKDCKAPPGWDAGSVGEDAITGGGERVVTDASLGGKDTGPAPTVGCGTPKTFEPGAVVSSASVEGTWRGKAVTAADAVAVTHQGAGEGSQSAGLTIRLTPYNNACGHELAALDQGGASVLEVSVTVFSETEKPAVPKQTGKFDVPATAAVPDKPYLRVISRSYNWAEGNACGGGGLFGVSQCGNDVCESGEDQVNCKADCGQTGSITITSIAKEGNMEVVSGSFTYTEGKKISVSGTFKAPICNLNAEGAPERCCMEPPEAGG